MRAVETEAMIDKSTGVSIGIAVSAIGLTWYVATEFQAVKSRIDAIQIQADEIPSIKEIVLETRRDVAELKGGELASQAWKRRHMASWCRQTERINGKWMCADPFEVQP